MKSRYVSIRLILGLALVLCLLESAAAIPTSGEPVGDWAWEGPVNVAPQAVNTIGLTLRVSVASDGSEENGSAHDPAISADGRWVAFRSGADNLVPGDTNDRADIFVRDRQTGETRRISVASDGSESNGWPLGLAISADGRWVAFESDASNLVPGDTNDNWDIFVHDRQTGETRRVSVASDGSEGNGISGSPSISGNGRWVAFTSDANNLVSGDTNGVYDVFVHDLQTGETSRVSIASDGSQGDGWSVAPAISADGRWVAFQSEGDNLIPEDTNVSWDIFVHDRQTGETSRVSVADDGSEGDNQSDSPSISADGRWVTFLSIASNLVPNDTNGTWDVFVRDRQLGETRRVSVASNGAEVDEWVEMFAEPAISADGRWVAFESFASHLVTGDTNDSSDIFVHDHQTGETRRVSVASSGSEGNGSAHNPAISADGRWVVFDSFASNLVPGDTNGIDDVFVHDNQGYSSLLPLVRR